MLVLSRKPGQRIQIGNDITVTIVKTRGRAVRLGIDAPRHVRIVRNELPPLADRTPAEQFPDTSNRPNGAADQSRKISSATFSTPQPDRSQIHSPDRRSMSRIRDRLGTVAPADAKNPRPYFEVIK